MRSPMWLGYCLLLLALACCTHGTVTIRSADGGAKDSGLDAGGFDGGIIPSGTCSPPCAAPDLCDLLGQCVSCLSDSDCKGSVNGPHCDTRAGSNNLGSCEECVASSQCGMGLSCDPAQDACETTCNPSTCATSNQLCDPTSGACVDCISTADCQGNGLCNPTTHACVDCLTPADCPAGDPGCSLGVCGQCNQASDCPGAEGCVNQQCGCASSSSCPPAAPQCLRNDGGSPDAGTCGCTSSQACPQGTLCDPNAACVASCASDAGVCAALSGSVCDTTSGLCVGCLDGGSQCSAPAPYCVSGDCVECTADAQCDADAGTPYCGAGLCVECTGYAQCPASLPGCDSQSGSCGECSLPSDCPPELGCGDPSGICVPFCGTGAADAGVDCAACATATDCGGAACDGGQCL